MGKFKLRCTWQLNYCRLGLRLPYTLFYKQRKKTRRLHLREVAGQHYAIYGGGERLSTITRQNRLTLTKSAASPVLQDGVKSADGAAVLC